MVIRVGNRTIDGGGIRRKPLALLAFLLTRPDFASTKDQIIDALWPDADPSDAANSLHQTLYFLRRAFEPAFAEETSPGYVSYVSDVIWLDQHLVDSRSAQCRRLLAKVRARDGSDAVDALAAAYRGRFALEFAYEEWAVTYRDYLHAAYLEAIEMTVRQRSEQGDLEGALRLAQAALEADPDADAVELSVLRLYRTAGAHAAAAEQHAHYSRVIADLGEEAPEIGLA